MRAPAAVEGLFCWFARDASRRPRRRADAPAPDRRELRRAERRRRRATRRRARAAAGRSSARASSSLVGKPFRVLRATKRARERGEGRRLLIFFFFAIVARVGCFVFPSADVAGGGGSGDREPTPGRRVGRFPPAWSPSARPGARRGARRATGARGRRSTDAGAPRRGRDQNALDATSMFFFFFFFVYGDATPGFGDSRDRPRRAAAPSPRVASRRPRSARLRENTRAAVFVRSARAFRARAPRRARAPVGATSAKCSITRRTRVVCETSIPLTAAFFFSSSPRRRQEAQGDEMDGLGGEEVLQRAQGTPRAAGENRTREHSRVHADASSFGPAASRSGPAEPKRACGFFFFSFTCRHTPKYVLERAAEILARVASSRASPPLADPFRLPPHRTSVRTSIRSPS